MSILAQPNDAGGETNDFIHVLAELAIQKSQSVNLNNIPTI